MPFGITYKKQPLVNINLTGYSFVNVDPVGTAAGVAMYVRNDLKITQEQNIYMSVNHCGKLCTNQTQKKTSIATIYRHPSQAVDRFVENFSNCLEKFAFERKRFYYIF